MEHDIRKEQFDRFSTDLPESVKKAIWDLLVCQHYAQGLCRMDGHLKLKVSEGASCIRYLTLYDASGVPEGADVLDFESLTKSGGEYRLTGEDWNEETEELNSFTICFSHAAVEMMPCRADRIFFENAPWRQLADMGTRIMEKYNISEQLLNDGEKELLPLLAELSKLDYQQEMPAPWNGTGFPKLKSFVQASGYPELLCAFERVEKNFSNPRCFQRLFAKLERAKYEPLFRTLWNTICSTQKNYSTASQIEMPRSKLQEACSRVTKIMEQLGYCGTYPDFYKIGVVNGLHLVSRHGADYFICGKKRAAFHIHFEELLGSKLQLMLYCGTQLLKENQTPGDILSCMFDARGRTYSKSLLCEAEEPGRLETIIPIADKLIRLKKLTREERDHIDEVKVPSIVWFLGCLILGGFCFSVLFIPLMMGLDALPFWLAGEPAVLSDVPWLQLFFATWLGFGSLTGALMALINYLKVT